MAANEREGLGEGGGAAQLKKLLFIVYLSIGKQLGRYDLQFA